MRQINFLLIFVVLAISLFSCAKRGSISGGPKDTIAPRMIRSIPANFSTGFNGKTVRIEFDEFVKLKDANKQLVVSPPMQNPVRISPSAASRYIEVTFNDTLRANTTYSLNFGQSIQDNNEGNPLSQFKYVFSTGTYIDSLQLSGIVKDALEPVPDEFISVMLYERNETFVDSVIYKRPPNYITNTLNASDWQLENLKEGEYLLMAITDKNGNNTYDPRSEKIGFINDIVRIPNDTIYALEMFKEQPAFSVTRPFQETGNRLTIGYTGSPKDAKIEVRDGNNLLRTIATKLPERDSLRIWIPPVTADSLLVTAQTTAYERSQWVKFKPQKADSLVIAVDSRRPMTLREPFSLISTTPIVQTDTTLISVKTKDSASVQFSVLPDTDNQTMTIDFPREPDTSYHIALLPGALTDFYGQVNDTLTFRADTKSSSQYGNLRVALENARAPAYIVELTDNKGAVKYSIVTTGAAVDFRWITPATYTLRVIYDENQNAVWDTGNYLEKRQPERVVYYPSPIEVRANWDVEQPFILP